jgi:hypothetical protein
MTLRLQFTTGTKEQLAHWEIANGRDPLAGHSYAHEVVVFALCVLGMFTAFKAASVMLLIPFLVVAIGAVTGGWRASRHRRKAIAQALADPARQNVDLTIDDAGVREVAEGVESFAPWSSVKSYAKLKGTFVLELAPGTAAVIPESALAGDVEAKLIAQLKAKSIPQRMIGPFE